MKVSSHHCYSLGIRPVSRFSLLCRHKSPLYRTRHKCRQCLKCFCEQTSATTQIEESKIDSEATLSLDQESIDFSSLTVLDLLRFIQENQIEAKIIRKAQPQISNSDALSINSENYLESQSTLPQNALEAQDLDRNKIKSLVYIVNDIPVLVILQHDGRVDESKLRNIFQNVSRTRIGLAPKSVVLRACGYPVGCVPPLGPRHPSRTLIDAGVEGIVFGGGGDDDHDLRISLDELIKLGGEVADIAVRQSDDSPYPQKQLSQVLVQPWKGNKNGEFVTLIGIVSLRRRMSKQLVFLNIVPHNVPKLPLGGTAVYLRKVWAHPEDERPCEVQLIMGNTIAQKIIQSNSLQQTKLNYVQNGNSSKSQKEDIFKGVKVGNVIKIVGKPQPQPNGGGGGGRDDILDVVCHDVEILFKNVDQMKRNLPFMNQQLFQVNLFGDDEDSENSPEEAEETEENSENGKAFDSSKISSKYKRMKPRKIFNLDIPENNIQIVDTISGMLSMREQLGMSVFGFNEHSVVNNQENLNLNFENQQNNKQKNNITIVGLDCEWQPFKQSDKPTPVSLLQIATTDRVFLLDFQSLCRSVFSNKRFGNNYKIIRQMPKININSNFKNLDLLQSELVCSDFLWDLFADPNILKVGFQFAYDVRRMRDSFPHLPLFCNRSDRADYDKILQESIQGLGSEIVQQQQLFNDNQNNDNNINQQSLNNLTNIDQLNQNQLSNQKNINGINQNNNSSDVNIDQLNQNQLSIQNNTNDINQSNNNSFIKNDQMNQNSLSDDDNNNNIINNSINTGRNQFNQNQLSNNIDNNIQKLYQNNAFKDNIGINPNFKNQDTALNPNTQSASKNIFDENSASYNNNNNNNQFSDANQQELNQQISQNDDKIINFENSSAPAPTPTPRTEKIDQIQQNDRDEIKNLESSENSEKQNSNLDSNSQNGFQLQQEQSELEKNYEKNDDTQFNGKISIFNQNIDSSSDSQQGVQNYLKNKFSENNFRVPTSIREVFNSFQLNKNTNLTQNFVPQQIQPQKGLQNSNSQLKYQPPFQNSQNQENQQEFSETQQQILLQQMEEKKIQLEQKNQQVVNLNFSQIQNENENDLNQLNQLQQQQQQQFQQQQQKLNQQEFSQEEEKLFELAQYDNKSSKNIQLSSDINQQEKQQLNKQQQYSNQDQKQQIQPNYQNDNNNIYNIQGFDKNINQYQQQQQLNQKELNSPPQMPHEPKRTPSYGVQSMVHVGLMARDLQIINTSKRAKKQPRGLSNLVFSILGKRLDKTQQCSDWSLRPLSREQIIYSAVDSLSLVRMVEKLSQGNEGAAMNPRNWRKWGELVGNLNSAASVRSMKIQQSALVGGKYTGGMGRVLSQVKIKYYVEKNSRKMGTENLDANLEVLELFLGRKFHENGRQIIMQMANRTDKGKSAPVPKFTRGSSVIEWKNLIMLFITVGQIQQHHNNEFYEDGKYISWFLPTDFKFKKDDKKLERLRFLVRQFEKKQENEEISQGTTFILFCKPLKKEYVYLGKLSLHKVEFKSNGEPSKLIWELLQIKDIQQSQDFQDIRKLICLEK